MTALVVIAAIVFTLFVVVGQVVWERRQRRRAQEQWEARERSLNRKP
jgi:uncharacterized membrane protein